MKNKILLLLIIPIILIVNKSFSQDSDSLKTYYTGEIVVTSENEAIIKTTSTIDIDKTRIDSKDNFSLNESMTQIPGLVISQNQRNESLFKVRGYDQRQTAVFFDGVPLYISYDGTYDFSQISSAPIGKITISKSMSSVLYGVNTLGGSINIITDEPSRTFETYAKIMYGNNYGGLLRTSGIYKSFIWLLSANYNKSDGFNLPTSFASSKNENGDKRENSSSLQKGLTMKAGYKFNDNTDFTLTYVKALNSKDVPTQIYTNFPRYWKYTDWNNTLINFISNFKISPAFTVRTNVYTVNSYNVLNAYDNNTFTTQNKPSSFISTYDDYSTGVSIIPELNINKVLSAKFALLYKRDTHYDQSNYNKPNKRFTAETYTGGVEKNFVLMNLDVITALNFNYLNIVYANDSATRSGVPVLNGHLGVGKSLSESVYLYAHLSNNSRYPTLKELFSEHLGKNLSNPNLEEERSWNTEAGVKYKNNKVGDINLAIFYSDVRNMILNIPVGTNLSQYQNVGKVTLGGLEVTYHKSSPYIDFDFNYTYLNSKNKSDTATDKLEYRPEHVLNFTLGKLYSMGLSWQFETALTSSRYGIDPDTRVWKTLPDYAIFNVRVSQTIMKKYSLFARVNNLSDKYYETEYGFPQSGRNFVFGIEANF